MKIFDTVSTFAKGVGKKAKGNYDVIAIKSKVSDCEKQKSKLLCQVGEVYYEAHKVNPVDEVANLADSAKQLEEKIENYIKLAEEKKTENNEVKLVSENKEESKNVLGAVSTFTKGVGKKTKGNYDVIALNSMISDCEKKKTKLVHEIGEKYYESYSEKPVDDVADIIEQIKEIEANIEKYTKLAEEKKAETDAVKMVATQNEETVESTNEEKVSDADQEKVSVSDEEALQIPKQNFISVVIEFAKRNKGIAAGIAGGIVAAVVAIIVVANVNSNNMNVTDEQIVASADSSEELGGLSEEEMQMAIFMGYSPEEYEAMQNGSDNNAESGDVWGIGSKSMDDMDAEPNELTKSLQEDAEMYRQINERDRENVARREEEEAKKHAVSEAVGSALIGAFASGVKDVFSTATGIGCDHNWVYKEGPTSIYYECNGKTFVNEFRAQDESMFSGHPYSRVKETRKGYYYCTKCYSTKSE